MLSGTERASSLKNKWSIILGNKKLLRPKNADLFFKRIKAIAPTGKGGNSIEIPFTLGLYKIKGKDLFSTM